MTAASDALALRVALARVAQGLPALVGDHAPTGRLAVAEASERDCRYGWAHSDAQCEWGTWIRPMAFRRCRARLLIVRQTIGGGIDGGWKYASAGAMDVEWSQILTIAFRFGNANLQGARP